MDDEAQVAPAGANLMAALSLPAPGPRLVRSRTSVAEGRVTNGHVVAIGSLLLLLPNVLFALDLALLPGVILSIGALACVAIFKPWPARASEGLLAKPLAVPRLSVCICLSSVLLVMGGEDHLMFANWDWLWRDSVLADLSRTAFPPTYKVADQTFFLRAPLGMYMMPALVAKAAGLGIGHAALLLQNCALLSCVLYMLAAVAGRRAMVAVLIFLSFSGLDIVGQLFMWLKAGNSLSTFTLPSHIENWTDVQYSSVVTQLFWAPNHALPSYWLALLVVLCARGELRIDRVVVVHAASLFWSPFAFIGAFPLVGYLILRRIDESVLCKRFWFAILACVCFFPVALYMEIDAAQVPHEFLLFHPSMAVLIALFLIVEIPHLAVIRIGWVGIEPSLRGILVVSIAVLVILPSLHVGVSGDLAMKGSIPAMTILAFAFAQALCGAWDQRRPALLGAGLAMTFIGAVTPAQEAIRAWTFPPFAVSDCNLVTVWKEIWPRHLTLENYLARGTLLPPWLVTPPKEEALTVRRGPTCWPGLPFPPTADVSILSTMPNAAILRLGDGAKRAR